MGGEGCLLTSDLLGARSGRIEDEFEEEDEDEDEVGRAERLGLYALGSTLSASGLPRLSMMPSNAMSAGVTP